MALLWILAGIAYILYATCKEGDFGCAAGLIGFAIVMGVGALIAALPLGVGVLIFIIGIGLAIVIAVAISARKEQKKKDDKNDGNNTE